MRQDDSGAALQRTRRLFVQVRDGSRVVEDFVTHDKFWIRRRCRLESEYLGAASGELPAGRAREVEVQERADCLDVVSLPRAIGLIPTNGHGDALRSFPYRARAAFHPETTPRRCSSSIHRQKGLLAGTSVKTGVVQAGGSNIGFSVRSTKTAICSRVTDAVGQ